MELREYIRIFHKSWILIVAATLLGLGLGAVASLAATPQYEARTQLYVSVQSDVGSTGDLVQGTNYARQIVGSYVDVVRTGIVLDPVAEQLQLDITGAELASYVTASSPTNTVLINITASSPDPEQAALIANAVGESFKDVVRNDLEPERASGQSPVSLTTTQVALTPTAAVSPNTPVNLALGLLLGLAVGVGVAVLRSTLDTRIHSLHDIEQITDKPLIGGIVDDPDAQKNPLIVHAQPNSGRAESFRALRTNLQFLNVGSQNRAFVITSSGLGEGKSTTAANLAFSLAQTGSRVALIEGDLRLPMVCQYLGIEGGAGLTDVLIGKATLNDVLQRWGRTQLYVLPAGRTPPNPSELLGSAEMEKVVATLNEHFDYVIIDAPPSLAVTDAAVMGSMTAGILLVVASGRTTKQAFEGALRTLETAGTNVLGIIATMLATKGPDSYGYGAYGYGYGTQEALEAGPVGAAEKRAPRRRSR